MLKEEALNSKTLNFYTVFKLEILILNLVGWSLLLDTPYSLASDIINFIYSYDSQRIEETNTNTNTISNTNSNTINTNIDSIQYEKSTILADFENVFLLLYYDYKTYRQCNSFIWTLACLKVVISAKHLAKLEVFNMILDNYVSVCDFHEKFKFGYSILCSLISKELNVEAPIDQLNSPNTNTNNTNTLIYTNTTDTNADNINNSNNYNILVNNFSLINTFNNNSADNNNNYDLNLETVERTVNANIPNNAYNNEFDANMENNEYSNLSILSSKVEKFSLTPESNKQISKFECEKSNKSRLNNNNNPSNYNNSNSNGNNTNNNNGNLYYTNNKTISKIGCEVNNPNYTNQTDFSMMDIVDSPNINKSFIMDKVNNTVGITNNINIYNNYDDNDNENDYNYYNTEFKLGKSTNFDINNFNNNINISDNSNNNNINNINNRKNFTSSNNNFNNFNNFTTIFAGNNNFIKKNTNFPKNISEFCIDGDTEKCDKETNYTSNLNNISLSTTPTHKSSGPIPSFNTSLIFKNKQIKRKKLSSTFLSSKIYTIGEVPGKLKAKRSLSRKNKFSK